MKPIGSAQGKGIFLFTKLHEISEWKNTDSSRLNNYNTGRIRAHFVLMKYIYVCRLYMCVCVCNICVYICMYVYVIYVYMCVYVYMYSDCD